MRKPEEKRAINYFIKAKKLHWRILQPSAAEKLFPEYNGENPDCVVYDCDKKSYIGIELFRLDRPSSRGLLQKGVNSRSHLLAKIQIGEIQNDWISRDVFYGIIEYNVSKKMEVSKYYPQNLPIWLVGYELSITQGGGSLNSPNIGIVRRIQERGINKNLIANIFSKSILHDVQLWVVGTLGIVVKLYS